MSINENSNTPGIDSQKPDASGDKRSSDKRPENRMGTAPVGNLLFRMSIPAIISMTIHALYNVVDSIFVSWISEDALTALSLVNPLQLLMISFAVGTGIGLNSLISRRLGGRMYEEANDAASHGMFLSTATWLIFALLGIFFSGPFVSMFTDDPEILLYGTQYCTIILIGSFFAFIQTSIEKVFQATGNMIFPMITGTIGGVVNIILDPILIFGLFGLPRMEVIGAAIATVFGQFCGMVACVIFAKTKLKEVKISLRFHFRFKTIKDIYAVAFPSIVMQAITSVLITLLNGILATFSTTAIAVLGVYFKLQSFVFMPAFGLNQGLMPIIGYNFGACNRKRMSRAFKLGAISSACIMGAGFMAFQIFPGALMSMFDAEGEMFTMGVHALRVISLCFLPASFCIVCSGFFQATGHGFYSLIISLVRQIAIILPAAYILSVIGGVGAFWFSYPLAECVSVPICIVMLRQIYKTQISKMEAPVR